MKLLEALSNKRLLVTGASGFIGSWVVGKALAFGAKVIALHREGSDLFRLARCFGRPGFTLRAVGDLGEPEGIFAALAEERPEIVISAAGLTDWRQAPELTPTMLKLHTLGTAYLLNAAREAGVGRVVLLGSAGEYGAAESPCREDGPALPKDPYSASKLAATELGLLYSRSFGLSCTIVRPFQVYGPFEAERRLLPSLFARALSGSGQPVDLTSGEQLRDFVFVEDVAEGILRAALAPEAAGKVLNLGTGVATSVREAIQLAVEIAGHKVTPRFGALPYRVGEPMALFAEMGHTLSILSWKPSVSLEEGLRRMWQHMQTRGDSTIWVHR